jgi:MOSC domain-containing protein YiiM
VEGDYHFGKYVRHRYLVKKEPGRLNNRQVLLVDTVILEDLRSQGIILKPGEMGENMILDGIDLMHFPLGTRLQVDKTLLELTEVREPCAQLNESHPDLLEAVQREEDEEQRYLAGIFARVLTGGWIMNGDAVKII